VTADPELETSERGEEDDVGMECGEKSGDDAEADVVELDLACCELEEEMEPDAASGMETWGS